MAMRKASPHGLKVEEIVDESPRGDWRAERDIIQNTSRIVSSYAANNSISASELAKVIGAVADALRSLSVPSAPKAPVPAVPVNKSVTRDFIVCLEDGKKLKMLKRHLRTAYDMSPDDYRAKWDLPPHYPMVAPGYAAARSRLAKKTGLGRVGAPRTSGRRAPKKT